MITTLTELNVESELTNFPSLLLVDFWAEWCGPCKTMLPILEELSTQFGNKLKIAKLNVGDYPQLANRWNVSTLPTIIIFRNGDVLQQLVGLRSRKDIVAAVQLHL